MQRLKGRHKNYSDAFTLVELCRGCHCGHFVRSCPPNSCLKPIKQATEAKTNLSATLKQAHAKFLEDGNDPESAIADMTTFYGPPKMAYTFRLRRS